MSDTVKQTAITFKKRAKELGYEIKLTHCQEILAKINGHNNRHSYLLEDSKEPQLVVPATISPVYQTANIQSDLMENIIKSLLLNNNHGFTVEQLNVVNSEIFKKDIEKAFFNTLYHTIHEKNRITFKDDEKFIFTFKNNLIQNVQELVQNKSDEYSFENYIFNLENNKYRDHFHLGLIKQNGRNVELIKNFQKEPNALFVGGMGSGKTVSAVFTAVSWMLANSNQSRMYIVDALKGAEDFRPLFKYPQVKKIDESKKILQLIDELHEEAMMRRDIFKANKCENLDEYESLSKTKLSRIVVFFEEFQFILNSILNFNIDYKTPGTAAFKYCLLMRIGRALGIWFVGVTQTVATEADIPREIMGDFTQKQVFRVPKADANYILGNIKASEIKYNTKGRCETVYGTVQFPYIDDETIDQLLKKYIKVEQSKCLCLK